MAKHRLSIRDDYIRAQIPSGRLYGGPLVQQSATTIQHMYSIWNFQISKAIRGGNREAQSNRRSIQLENPILASAFSDHFCYHLSQVGFLRLRDRDW